LIPRPHWLVLFFLVLACAPATSRAGSGRLDGLFAAAEKDPASIVPLILEVSREVSTAGYASSGELADRLEPYCSRVFFSTEVIPGSERLGVIRHTVEKNELPGRIAKQYKTAAELFPYLNPGYDERKLQAGRALRVLDLSDGSLSVEVVKSGYRLLLWRTIAGESGTKAPVLIACVPVGLGAPESPTPAGETRVEKRVRNPQWTHPETGQVFAPGDPGNVLGGYWMALAPAGIGKQGIGFHGYTGDKPEEWLEKPASNGCIRLLQKDIDRLFVVAIEGTPVILH
jgi:lipoprotein-anchoring transpeptidase ErfK/SrfK